jgi:hypothetical protein
MVTEELIFEFCKNLSMDLQCLVPKLEILHPEWDAKSFASNLMELGRGQISEIGEPNDKDYDFYNRYLSSLDFSHKQTAFSAAYFAGCVMGLVQKGHLPPDEFVQAVEFSRKFAEDELE